MNTFKIKIYQDESIGEDGFFTRKLNTHLAKTKYRPPRGQVIRPADIGSCPKGIVCDILGFTNTQVFTPQQQRIFDNGNFVHKRYLEYYMSKLGCVAHILDEHDTKVRIKDFIECGLENKEYWLRGKPDAVIINEEDGLPYIFELKSVKQENFNELIQPDASYTAQVYLYMFLTGIPRAIVFYENKNTQATKEFLILKDETKLETYLQKIRMIQKFVLEYPETKKLPACECNGYQCNKFTIPE